MAEKKFNEKCIYVEIVYSVFSTFWVLQEFLTSQQL